VAEVKHADVFQCTSMPYNPGCGRYFIRGADDRRTVEVPPANVDEVKTIAWRCASCSRVTTAGRQWTDTYGDSLDMTAVYFALEAMLALPDAERREVMARFCRGCAGVQPENGPGCRCWDDS
jgi:hypothetical protein